MASRCRLNLVIYVISLIFGHCAALGPSCSAATFGVPPWDDCIAAFSRIPFAGNYLTIPDARLFQLFGEPQYLIPTFGPVVNRYAPRPINQIPKIWQFNQCRIALMSYGEGPAKAVKPLFGASWNQILVQLETVKQCIRPAEGGTSAGGWTPFTFHQAQVTGDSAAALYMYSVDSPFVNYVNRYMSNGWAIKPPNSESEVITSLANYSSITNQSVTPNFSTPDMAVNVTFLDRTD